MNPDEDHDEHNNILKYSQEHNNIMKYGNLPRISSESWWVPGHVAQDYWSHSNGQKTSRNFLNRDQSFSIKHTFAKQKRKTPKKCLKLYQ